MDYIPGVGIDLKKIPEHDKEFLNKKKAELGLPADKMIVLSSGELIKRKNHEAAIRTMAWLHEQKKINTPDTPQIHYVICGHGKRESYLKQLVHTLKISDIVTFTGYREDMLDIYPIADVFLFPSYQEGLPMSLLEAMASGLPVICSDIRGCRDLMGPAKTETDTLKLCAGGIMTKNPDDVESYGQALLQLLADSENLKKSGYKNKLRSCKFSIEMVDKEMRRIYGRLG